MADSPRGRSSKFTRINIDGPSILRKKFEDVREPRVERARRER